MKFYYTLFYVNSSLLAALIIFKTYLFVSKTNFHRLVNWIHFSRYNIYTSRGDKIVKAKQTQNTLSVVILVFIILDLSFLLMAHLAA